ncbi:MAG: TonB-dependent receptor [Bacteroidales bacterium]|nr:TonB-dependent receptor [Bacteroidales bacterium]
MKRLLLFLATFVALTSTAFAQAPSTIRGKVTFDEDGQPLPGVSVFVQGTQVGAVTDLDGNYVITNVPSSARILVFSFIGMETQELPVAATVNAVMSSDSEALQEAVVTIAYGAAKRSTLTGAISQVSSDKIANRPVSTVTSALEGTVTGVQVNSTYGNPGSDPSIMIRGNGTINGSSAPLYVIDGVPYGGNLSDLNPADIESMTVLKDAASAALYGNRASNGVILITTKKGSQGRMSVQFSATAGTYNRGIPEYELADAREFMDIQWLALKNDRQYYYGDAADAAAAYANENLISERLKLNIFDKPADKLFKDGKLVPDANILKGYQDDLDWFDQTINPGNRMEYNLSASGATDKSDYYFSVGYLDEQGYLNTSGFDRLSGRASVNVKPTTYMKLGLNLNATHQSYLNTSTSSNAYVNPFMYCRNIAPIYPVHLHDVNTGEYILDADGNKQYDPGYYFDADGIQIDTRNQYVDRHVIWENELNKDVSTRNTMNAIATAEFYFLRDFTLTFNGNINLRSDIEQSYDSGVIGDGKGNNGRGSRSEYNYKNYTFQQQLRWTHQFGDHNLNALIGHENYANHYDYLYGYKTSEVFPNINNLNNFTSITDLYNYANNYRTESYLSRVRYNYQDKYNLEASFRRDGSSRFHKDARWGNFWSVGANWMISKEDFMQSVAWVNSLKLRADFGEVGNDSGSGLYGYQALYTSDQNANKGAYYLSQLPNPDLKWETGQSWGIGIESRLFNKVTLNIDYFDRRNKDLLFGVILPISAGPTSSGSTNPSVTQNIGTMSNRGIEIETNIDIVRTRDWKVNFFANATFLKSKILSLPEQNRKEGIIDGTKRYVEGGDRYAYWLYQFAGVDQMTGLSVYELDDERFYVTDNGTPDGKIIYGKAEDEEGNAHSLMDPKNYTVINGVPYVWNPGSYGKKDWSGTATPKVNGSFGLDVSFKGLTLSSLFTYALGAKVYDGIYAAKMGASANPSSVHEDNLKGWTGVPAGMTETSPDRIDPNGIPMIYTFSTYGGSSGPTISNDAGTSTRWLTSGNYLVVKNIALTYELPKRWLTPLQIQGLSLTAACENLFTKAARKGLNPQYSFGGVTSTNTFVTARVFTAGINVRF